jgi:hypothetical protein
MSDDPILKKIFNRFYPKSQTTDEGRKLYKLAWAIEILVVLAGLTTALVMTISPDPDTKVDNAILISIALVFVIAAIAELTKIPLATAFYYAVRLNWKITFFIALMLVNFLTFETIVNGLLRNYQISTAPIKVLQYQLADLTNQRVNADIIIDNKKKEVQKQIDQIKINKTSALSDQTNIMVEQASERESIAMSSEGGSVLKGLIESKKNKEKKVSDLDDKILNLSTAECESTFLTQGACDKQRDAQASLQSQVDKLNNEISQLDQDIAKLTAKIEGSNDTRLKEMNNKYQIQKDRLEAQIKSLDEQMEIQLARLAELDKGSIDRIKNNKALEEKERELILEINAKAIANPFYSLANILKSKSDKTTGTEVSEPWFSFSWLNFGDKSVEVVNTGDPQNKGPSQDAGTLALMTHQEDQFYLITEKDLKFAFWLFFGSMAIVISLAGTLVALASLHLQDPRMQEDRKRAKRIGATGKFFRSLQYVFIAIRKRLMKPKIVKIINEKEVIVDKEVIKEVPVDKIVFRDVPREIIRRELVHVPMYTNDKDMLGTTTFKDTDITTEELDEALKEIRKKNKKQNNKAVDKDEE